MSKTCISKLYPVADLNLDDYLISSLQPDGEVVVIDDEEVKYLNVDGKILWFRKVYPHGAITTERLIRDDGLIEFVAKVYKDNDATKLPLATGHAEGFRGDDQYMPYESIESTAIGRALNVAGFGTEQKIKVVQQIKKEPEGNPRENYLPNNIRDKMLDEDELTAEEIPDKEPTVTMDKPTEIVGKTMTTVEDEAVLDDNDPLAILGAKSRIQREKEAAQAKEAESQEIDEPKAEEATMDNDEATPPNEIAEPSKEAKSKRGRKPKATVETKEETELKENVEQEEKPTNHVDASNDSTPTVEISEEIESTFDNGETEEADIWDMIIQASDVSSEPTLELYVGKPVSAISKDKMLSIMKYLKDSVSDRLYNAVVEHLKNNG